MKGLINELARLDFIDTAKSVECGGVTYIREDIFNELLEAYETAFGILDYRANVLKRRLGWEEPTRLRLKAAITKAGKEQ